jgi:hypothetical protein
MKEKFLKDIQQSLTSEKQKLGKKLKKQRKNIDYEVKLINNHLNEKCISKNLTYINFLNENQFMEDFLQGVNR